MSRQNSSDFANVKVMLKTGVDGVGIASIEKTGTSLNVDTYTITLTNGNKSTFTVTNGTSIASIEKTSTVGNVDTYTITLTDDSTWTFTVTNGIATEAYMVGYDGTASGLDADDVQEAIDEVVTNLGTVDGTVNEILRRGRNNITNNLSNLSTAVSEQNLEKYGYSIGDYFVGASGYTYILADMNTFKGTLTPYCLTTNHIGIVVDTHATTKWYTGDASAVGYNGSTLKTLLNGTVLNNIKSDFTALFGAWNTHLLAHTKLYTTALANWAWQDDQYISAMTEVQIYGSQVWDANAYQTGEGAKKLALFDKYKWTEIFGDEYVWLRGLNSASGACLASNYGGAHINSVTNEHYAVGLINFY